MKWVGKLWLSLLKLRDSIMGTREINLQQGGQFNDNSKLRGIDELGKSSNYSGDALATYFRLKQAFALYDGATDIASYEETFTQNTHLDVRLGFSGPLTDENYFPAEYGTLMINDESAPAATKFDFRSLPLGAFIEFDIEFTVLANEAIGDAINPSEQFSIDVKFIYPNGDQEIKTVTAKSTYFSFIGSNNVNLFNRVKMTFSTYIKNTLTDSLLGGYIEIDESGSPIENQDHTHTIKNLIVRAKL